MTGAGYRVLVDRLWPRGITKAEAALDEWLKDVAPSTELRRWYGHDVERFDEFARRYRAELRRPPASVAWTVSSSSPAPSRSRSSPPLATSSTPARGCSNSSSPAAHPDPVADAARAQPTATMLVDGTSRRRRSLG